MSQIVPVGYGEWLSELKERIHQTRRRAATVVNSAMVQLYWRIGREILDRQERDGWGAKIVDRLAADLHAEFPDAKGFSPRNLKYMQKLARAWPGEAIVQGCVAQLPWGHHTTLLDKLDDLSRRRWYAEAAVKHGWTRDVLVHQIQTRLYERQGQAITNFATTMPADRAAVATDLFKDPYVLDFVAIDAEMHERHLERALTNSIREFLLELGTGFAFIGSQKHLNVANQDFYIDLLFYHTRLHSYIAVDLKMGDFEPEFTGKMNFYLAALDEQMRTEGDQPSIGLILCRSKNGLVVEYALRGIGKPIAVSSYDVLPPEIARLLPSPEMLEAELDQRLPTSENEQEDQDIPNGP